jgi:hypothetical protein
MEEAPSFSMTQIFETKSLFFRDIASHVVLEPPTQITTFNQNGAPGVPNDYWFVNTNIVGNVITSLLELSGDYALAPLAGTSSNFELPDLSTSQSNWGIWARYGVMWVFGGISELWTYSGRGGLQRNGSVWNTVAPLGQQTAMLQGNAASPTTPGTMEKTYSLSGGTYVISFLSAQRPTYSPQTVQVSIKYPGTPTFTVLENLTPVGTSYSRQIVNFTSPSGSVTIRLQVTDSTGDRTLFVDDFKLLY